LVAASVSTASYSQNIGAAAQPLPDAPTAQGGLLLANNASGESSSVPDAFSMDGAAAQQTPATPPPSAPAASAPAGPPPASVPPDRKQESEEELQKELHQRVAGIVPNFNAVLDGTNIPLSPGQKMRAAFRSAIDPYQFGLAGFTSMIGQAENSHTTYAAIPNTTPTQYAQMGFGQGWAGYGKRIGASYTDQFDGTILGNGVFPILLHQDARYYRMGTGSFKKRFLYSIGTTVYCKGNNGKWQPNVSNVLGNLAAGGISNLYYPAADRGFGLTIEQGLLVTAEGAFGALVIEFEPDIVRHFRKKHLPAATPRPTAPGQSQE